MQIVALKPLCVAVALTGVIAITWVHRTPPTRPAAREFHCPAPPEVQSTSRRLVVKEQLARRVVMERMALLEAAELFRRANGEDGLAALARGGPGRSVREKLCRQVVAYAVGAEAEMRAEGYTSCVWGVAADLEAEFQRRLAAGDFPPEPGME